MLKSESRSVVGEVYDKCDLFLPSDKKKSQKREKFFPGHSLVDVISLHPHPTLGKSGRCIGFARVWSPCLATRNNMASNEEGSTHTRTIQKRAKKTQDQACQFDASLLEGERCGKIFTVYTQCSSAIEDNGFVMRCL